VDRTHQLLQDAGEAATINELLIPPPAPPIDPRLTRPPGGGGGRGGGDRLQRYANRMYGSRGRGRGGGTTQVDGHSQEQGNGQEVAVEKLLDV
jgi:hypothetical protein